MNLDDLIERLQDLKARTKGNPEVVMERKVKHYSKVHKGILERLEDKRSAIIGMWVAHDDRALDPENADTVVLLIKED